MQGAKVTADHLGLVVFASSNADWSTSDEVALLGTLYEMGIRDGNARIIGLQLQNCSGLGSALDISRALLQDDPSAEALIVICGRVTSGRSRLGASTGTVFGDGATSCIASTRPAGFEIVTAATHINPALANLPFSSKTARLRFNDLRQTINQAYRRAGIAANDVVALLGTNGNTFYFQLMAEAAGVPVSKVYTDDLVKFGHIFSCDNLIALKNYGSTNRVGAGDLFLVIGWSPYAVSVVILRAT